MSINEIYENSLSQKTKGFSKKEKPDKIIQKIKKLDKKRQKEINKRNGKPKEPRAVLNKEDLPHWIIEPENTLHENKRDKMREVVLLMAYLGLRVTEAINFQWNKQEWITDRWFFKILGKGNKYRHVSNIFAHPYIKSKAELARKYPELFEKTAFKVCRSGVFAYLKRYKEKTQWKLDKPGFPAPHDFRRSFATRLAYEEGIHLIAIQKLLGHEDFETTQKYFKDDTRQLVCLLNRSGNKPD